METLEVLTLFDSSVAVLALVWVLHRSYKLAEMTLKRMLEHLDRLLDIIDNTAPVEE